MQDQTLQLAQQGLVFWVYFVVLLIYRNGHEMNKDRHLAAIQKDKSTNRVKKQQKRQNRNRDRRNTDTN
jgi:hypothetical protein